MNINITQAALLALELFRLNPNSKKGLKLIQQHLVEVALYINPKDNSKNNIIKTCSELLGHEYILNEADCNLALLTSVKSGRILKRGNNDYILADHVVKELISRNKEYSESQSSFFIGLSENVGRKLNTVINPFAEPLLLGAVRDVIQQLFYDETIKFTSLLSAKKEIIAEFDEDSRSLDLLREKLIPFVSIQKNCSLDQTIGGIKYFLGNLNPKQQHYVGNLHRLTVYLQILNIDPHLQEIEKNSLEKMRLYLDTNVAISYLCEGCKNYRPVFDVLQASILLGVKLFVSPITLEESSNLIHEALQFSPYLKDGRIDKVLQASSSSIDNPIIEGFITQKRTHSNLSWEAYVSPFRNLEEYLLSYNVLVEKELSELIINDEHYNSVYKQVSSIKEGKNDNIIIHDSSNFILINRLRKKYPGTPLGTSIWLITLDRKLPILDGLMHRSFSVPHCRLVEQWGEVLINFQNVGKFLASDEYLTYLASQKLGALIPEDTLDLHIFESITNSEVVCEKILSLQPEIASAVIRDLQKDRESAELLEQLKTTPKEKQGELLESFEQKISNFENNEIQAISQQYEDESNRLKKGIDELSEQLKALQSSREKDAELIRAISEKLKTTEEQLSNFQSMPFFKRLKRLIKP